MTKELLTIEFRYHDAPKGDWDSEYKDKTITLGIFDTLEEAIEEGNKYIKVLSEHFEVRSDDKFMLKFLFGNPNRLVSNTCYGTNGITYFAQIKKLEFNDLTETINETFKALERYKKFKKENY